MHPVAYGSDPVDSFIRPAWDYNFSSLLLNICKLIINIRILSSIFSWEKYVSHILSRRQLNRLLSISPCSMWSMGLFPWMPVLSTLPANKLLNGERGCYGGNHPEWIKIERLRNTSIVNCIHWLFAPWKNIVLCLLLTGFLSTQF